MNKYYTEQTSRTFGTVMMAGILASTSLPRDCSDEHHQRTKYFSESNNYIFAFRGTSTTHEPDNFFLTRHYPSFVETTFESVVTSFFEELSSNQEPLGHEFERVLFENLWDLYQS